MILIVHQKYRILVRLLALIDSSMELELTFVGVFYQPRAAMPVRSLTSAEIEWR
jgi:hypothetical protein